MTSTGVAARLDGTVEGRPELRRWVLLLSAWSLLVWGTRVANIVSDADLDALAKTWQVARALSFVGLGLMGGVLWWRHSSRPAARPVAGVLACWTIVVWIGRGGGIATGDHEATFIAVHLVLATVSIALAARVLTLSRRPTLTLPPSS